MVHWNKISVGIKARLSLYYVLPARRRKNTFRESQFWIESKLTEYTYLAFSWFSSCLNILIEKPKWRDLLADIWVGGRIILEWILGKSYLGLWVELSGSGWGTDAFVDTTRQWTFGLNKMLGISRPVERTISLSRRNPIQLIGV